MRKMIHSSLLWLRLFGAACAFLGNFAMTYAQTADAEMRSLSLDEYKKVKAYKIKDLEAETYVKFDGLYALDRYTRAGGEMVPPYVFKYSDGVERRIYLYKLLDNKTKKDLGAVAIYTTPANGKATTLCIPTMTADKTVWTAYIDDLKELGEKEKGFASTYAYVFSREMVGLMANGGQSLPTTTGAKTDYDVCFPAGSLVTLADGSQIAIEKVAAGDEVMTYKADQSGSTQVMEVQAHETGQYALTRLTLMPIEELTASVAASDLTTTFLEATPNHPVLTKEGRKELQAIKTGDVVYAYEHATHSFRPMKVQRVESQYRFVPRVYTLVTMQKSFVVNGTVVLDK